VEELCVGLRALCTFANQSTNYAVDLRKAQEVGGLPLLSNFLMATYINSVSKSPV
jgi:hypothetical protein